MQCLSCGKSTSSLLKVSYNNKPPLLCAARGLKNTRFTCLPSIKVFSRMRFLPSSLVAGAGPYCRVDIVAALARHVAAMKLRRRKATDLHQVELLSATVHLSSASAFSFNRSISIIEAVIRQRALQTKPIINFCIPQGYHY